MKRKLSIIAALVAVLIIGLIVSNVVLATSVYNKTIPETVTILALQPGLDAYSDVACTTPVTSISYGSLYPGQVAALQTMYIKNTGQINFATVNVNPSIGSSLATTALSTNNFPLTTGSVMQVDIGLTVSTTAAPGTYSTPLLNITGTY